MTLLSLLAACEDQETPTLASASPAGGGGHSGQGSAGSSGAQAAGAGQGGAAGASAGKGGASGQGGGAGGGGAAGQGGSAGSAQGGSGGSAGGQGGQGGEGGSAGQAGAGGSAGGGQGGSSGAAGTAALGCPTALPGEAQGGSWDKRFTLAGVSGQDGVVPTVYDFAEDADGSLLVAGYFRWIGETHVDGLARWVTDHFEPAGLDMSALEVPPGGFSAVAASADGKRAYAPNFGTAKVHGAVWVDTGSGVKEIGRYQGKMRRMAWIQGELWIAGAFALDEGGPKNLARWDGAAWKGVGGGDPDGVVFELLQEQGGAVLIGGEFTKVGGVAAGRVARWDGAAWSGSLGMPLELSARVLTLAYDGKGVLHAGGSFTLGTEASSSFARWSGASWEIVGGGVSSGSAFGVVSQLLPDGDGLIVSGCFDRVQGGSESASSKQAAGVARWDGASWQALDDGQKPVTSSWFDFGACGYEPDPGAVWDMRQQRLIRHGGAVFAGGSFAGLGGVPSQSVTSLDGSSWKAVGKAGAGLSGNLAQVRGVGPSCALHALAVGTHAGEAPLASPLLRWQDGWQPVGPSMPAGVSCSRFAFDADETPWLVCANLLTDAVGHVYRLHEGAWEPMFADLPSVFDVAFAPDGALFVAGGADKGFVARVEGSEAKPVGGDFDLLVQMLAFAPRGGGAYDVIAGGPFTKAGGVDAKRVARWDGTSWQPLGEGSENSPSALAATDEAVYLATFDEGMPGRKTLARWDGSAWTELATEANGLPAPMPETVHTFTSILPLAKGFVATGYVWPQTGGRNAFFFDGTSFTALGGGVAAIDVGSAALTPDGLWLSGTIAEAGAGSGLTSSVGVALLRWPAP